jgi:hypothetical protein
MLADIACANCAEQRIRDSVRQNVRVRVSFESARVRNLNTAQNKFSSSGEPMHIVADSATNHEENDE